MGIFALPAHAVTDEPAAKLTLSPGDRMDAYTAWHAQYGSAFDLLEQYAPRADAYSASVCIDTGSFSPAILPHDGAASEFVDMSIVTLRDGGRAESQDNHGRLVYRLPLLSNAIARPDCAPPLAEDVLERCRDAVRQPPTPFEGQDFDPSKLVITGVIDNQINLTNERFRLCDRDGKTPGTSRIDFAWIQDAPVQPSGMVAFGREWTGAQLDRVTERYGSDDVAALKALGVINADNGRFGSTASRISHGTHILDLAAGYDFRDGQTSTDPAHHRIVCVQLPALVTADTSGTHLTPMTVSAVKYIMDRALAMSMAFGVPIPLVINFSYGLGAGPHNGQHPIELILRKLIADYRTALLAAINATRSQADHLGEDDIKIDIILPAGNRRLAQAHARVSQTKKHGRAHIALPVRLQPDDRTSNFLEIWIDAEARFDQLEIIPPGNAMPIVISGAQLLADDEILLSKSEHGANTIASASIIGRISAPPPISDRFTKRLLSIALAPTRFDPKPGQARRATAPAGLWTITVKAADVEVGGRIDCWIQRDDIALGFNHGGRAAYFDEQTYNEERLNADGSVRLDDPADSESIVRRAGSLNAMATRPKNPSPNVEADIAVIGGAFGNSGDPVRYSGLGYRAGNQPINDPDAYRTAERSRFRSGVLASGLLNGSRVALSGTSVAAPQFAREVAAYYLQHGLTGG